MNRAEKKHIVVYVGICMFFLLFMAVVSHSCGQELEVSEYEENVNQIEEIDASERQAELNAIVEKGKMNVNYSAKAIFDGTVSENFNVKNIKNNHYPIVFEIFDETGDSVYVSKKIEPGYEINQIELEKKLSKGTHECKIKVGYAEEGNVSSAFPLTIEVR
ncbi:MAG: hypothetical protein IJA54_01205 [Tyzzerella sp.]|nr:hypothetical protein [Tyzzerella sp.]